MDVANETQATANNVAKNLGDMGHKAVDAAQKKMEDMSQTANDYYTSGRQKAGEFQDNIESYVREQPTKSVLIALGAGLLIGLFLSRK